jgi:hypothetical protein
LASARRLEADLKVEDLPLSPVVAQQNIESKIGAQRPDDSHHRTQDSSLGTIGRFAVRKDIFEEATVTRAPMSGDTESRTVQPHGRAMNHRDAL